MSFVNSYPVCNPRVPKTLSASAPILRSHPLRGRDVFEVARAFEQVEQLRDLKSARCGFQIRHDNFPFAVNRSVARVLRHVRGLSAPATAKELPRRAWIHRRVALLTGRVPPAAVPRRLRRVVADARAVHAPAMNGRPERISTLKTRRRARPIIA